MGSKPGIAKFDWHKNEITRLMKCIFKAVDEQFQSGSERESAQRINSMFYDLKPYMEQLFGIKLRKDEWINRITQRINKGSALKYQHEWPEIHIKTRPYWKAAVRFVRSLTLEDTVSVTYLEIVLREAGLHSPTPEISKELKKARLQYWSSLDALGEAEAEVSTCKVRLLQVLAADLELFGEA